MNATNGIPWSDPVTSHDLLSNLTVPYMDSHEDRPFFTTTWVIFTILYAVTGFWALVICTLIIVTMQCGLHQQTQKSSNLVSSLAFTGIFTGVIVIPWEIFGPLLPENHYEISYWLCKLCSYITAVGLAANEISEFLVILDECTANMRLSLPDLPERRTNVAILGLWAFSFIYNSHIFITHGFDPDMINAVLCSPFMGALEVKTFFVIDTMIFFFIPIVLWTILLIRIKYHIGHEMSSATSHELHCAKHSFVVLTVTYSAFILCQLPLIALSYHEEFRHHHQSTDSSTAGATNSTGIGDIDVSNHSPRISANKPTQIQLSKLLSYSFNWMSPSISALTRADVRSAMLNLFRIDRPSCICCCTEASQSGALDDYVHPSRRRSSCPAPASLAVHGSKLRFAGSNCYISQDNSRRSSELRQQNGKIGDSRKGSFEKSLNPSENDTEDASKHSRLKKPIYYHSFLSSLTRGRGGRLETVEDCSENQKVHLCGNTALDPLESTDTTDVDRRDKIEQIRPRLTFNLEDTVLQNPKSHPMLPTLPEGPGRAGLTDRSLVGNPDSLPNLDFTDIDEDGQSIDNLVVRLDSLESAGSRVTCLTTLDPTISRIN